jgi:hypothetical protein
MIQKSEMKKDSRYSGGIRGSAAVTVYQTCNIMYICKLPPLVALQDNQLKAARTSKLGKQWTKDQSGCLITVMQETPQKLT